MTSEVKRSIDRCPSHPGAFLREIVLPALSHSPEEIARALGMPRNVLENILDEKVPVTAAIAVKLGAVFDTSAQSWLAMQTAFDLWHAQRTTDIQSLQKLQIAS